MSSWVRYSVAVYIGLLLAGSLGPGWPTASAGPEQPRPRPAWLEAPTKDAHDPAALFHRMQAEAHRDAESPLDPPP